jgi:1-deoxyxylulose-5-phosphate synthase
MEYRRLGNSGLEVSRICLGCMSFGEPGRGRHPWSVDEAEAQKFFSRALESGINYFDTANAYSDGSSEEITGRALRAMANRDEIVIATKVHHAMHSGPNATGLSRKEIIAELDHSLRRLGTDYVDLYQIHRIDRNTPWEETLGALDLVVKAGKVRYVGASNLWAWELVKASYISSLHGWTRFVSMQNHYNLIYREDEYELIPACLDQGIGLIPYSPLARGRLARPWADVSTRRAQLDDVNLYDENAEPVVNAVGTLAERLGTSRARVSLAWLLSKPYITSVLVGTDRPEHIDDSVAALDLSLSDADLASLEAPYRPRAYRSFK